MGIEAHVRRAVLALAGLKYLCNTSERKQGGLIITGGGTIDAGGTKVLLRHRKDRIFHSKCYERKILVYVVVVMFNTWKVSSCQR